MLVPLPVKVKSAEVAATDACLQSMVTVPLWYTAFPSAPFANRAL